jgi:hypothetical protein
MVEFTNLNARSSRSFSSSSSSSSSSSLLVVRVSSRLRYPFPWLFQRSNSSTRFSIQSTTKDPLKFRFAGQERVFDRPIFLLWKYNFPYFLSSLLRCDERLRARATRQNARECRGRVRNCLPPSLKPEERAGASVCLSGFSFFFFSFVMKGAARAVNYFFIL